MPLTPTKRARRDTKPPARYRDAIEMPNFQEAQMQGALLVPYQRGSGSPAPHQLNNGGNSPSLSDKRERMLGSRSPSKRSPSKSCSPSTSVPSRASPSKGGNGKRAAPAAKQNATPTAGGTGVIPLPSVEQSAGAAPASHLLDSPLDLLAYATSAALGSTNGSNTRSADATDDTIDVGSAFCESLPATSLAIRADSIRTADSVTQSPTRAQYSGKNTLQSSSSSNQVTQHMMSASLRDNLKRVKNLLKLPKARRWVYCELFYGEIDKALLLGESEFDECVRDAFPNLRCRQMNRVQWRKLRSLLGKPRRSSQAFFSEERYALEARRQRVRALYAGRIISLADEGLGQAALPKRLTAPVPVGHKVHVRLRSPRDGLFLGTVIAVMEGEYRVSFEKDVLTTQIVPDFEVMREIPENEVPVMYFIDKNRAMMRRIESANLENVASTSQGYGNDSATAYSHQHLSTNNLIQPHNSCLPSPTQRTKFGTAMNVHPAVFGSERDRVGNYPVRALLLLVKTRKVLEEKRRLVAQLAELNAQAEKLQLFASKRYPRELQEKYAEVLTELESVNKLLSDNLCAMVPLQTSLQQGGQLGDAGGTAAGAQPNVDALRRQALTHATQIVKHCNHGLGVRSGRATELVTDLTGLLLQARELGRSQCGPSDLSLLSQTLSSVRSKLNPNNAALFQDHVEVHVQHMHQLMDNSAECSYAVYPLRGAMEDMVAVDVRRLQVPDITALATLTKIYVDWSAGKSVLRGADLFSAGLLASSAAFDANERVAVCMVIGGKCLRGRCAPLPTGDWVLIAVGVTTLSRAALFTNNTAPEVFYGVWDCPQNVPSALAVRALLSGWNDRAGGRVLDMCAAPGGKTAHLAALLGSNVDIVACESNKRRAEQLCASLRQLDYSSVSVCHVDATKLTKIGSCSALNDPSRTVTFASGSFDCILLDAPCSNSGQRPLTFDVANIKPKVYVPLQKRLFEQAVELLAPNGRLVFSTCSVSVEENECLVAWAIARSDFADVLRLSPPNLDLCEAREIGNSLNVPGNPLTEKESSFVLRFDPRPKCRMHNFSHGENCLSVSSHDASLYGDDKCCFEG